MGKNRQFKPETPERCRDENAMNLFWRGGAARHLRAGGGGAGVAPEFRHGACSGQSRVFEPFGGCLGDIDGMFSKNKNLAFRADLCYID
jgi:hypothetical protein